MTKLKLSAVPDDKPVKIAIELAAAIHRDLALYAEALAKKTAGHGRTCQAHSTDDRALHGERSGLRQGKAHQGLKHDPRRWIPASQRRIMRHR